MDNDPEMKQEFQKHILAVRDADERRKMIVGIKTSKDTKYFEYEYYYIKHPDHKCGPFKEYALPLALLEDYWRRKRKRG